MTEADKLARALEQLHASHPRKRARGGFSTAPIVLAGAIVLGYQLLVRLVPSLWAELLPGGFETGRFLPGAPRLVWWTAWQCYGRFPVVLGGAIGVTLVAGWMSRRPATRWVAWLGALGAIAVDAAILFVAIKAGMDAAGVGRSLGLGLLGEVRG